MTPTAAFTFLFRKLLLLPLLLPVLWLSNVIGGSILMLSPSGARRTPPAGPIGPVGSGGPLGGTLVVCMPPIPIPGP